ncbi:L-ascorbate metabolism protein UlaG (beta-lactamase superfamily) [Bacilli bacterium PM5-3]|nr:L-ascorbate metabolism protein UlaG (beta-lactamase superfamily) [Bacilli bacterium PM5-3]
MKFTQVRNATIILNYNGKKILFDPWLAKKGSLRSITSPDEKKNAIKNPTANLPISISEIVKDIDACIITHIHIDHVDEDSMKNINKDTKIFVQNTEDCLQIKGFGFNNIEILSENGLLFDNITLYKINGQHGETPETAEGMSCGVILKSDNEPTTYVCGDTIWYGEVKKAINEHNPNVIVLNACDARLMDTGRLIMNLDDIKKVRETSLDSKIIISHMEAVNHAFINRCDVREFVENNCLDNIYIPNDGESYDFK